MITNYKKLYFHCRSALHGVQIGEATEEQLHDMLRLRDISSHFAVIELKSRGLPLPGWYEDPRKHVGIGTKALMAGLLSRSGER
jgi:hypothetical protein